MSLFCFDGLDVLLVVMGAKVSKHQICLCDLKIGANSLFHSLLVIYYPSNSFDFYTSYLNSINGPNLCEVLKNLSSSRGKIDTVDDLMFVIYNV